MVQNKKRQTTCDPHDEEIDLDQLEYYRRRKDVLHLCAHVTMPLAAETAQNPVNTCFGRRCADDLISSGNSGYMYVWRNLTWRGVYGYLRCRHTQ